MVDEHTTAVPPYEETLIEAREAERQRGDGKLARLVDHFNREKRGEFKADICRVAELYLFGVLPSQTIKKLESLIQLDNQVLITFCLLELGIQINQFKDSTRIRVTLPLILSSDSISEMV